MKVFLCSTYTDLVDERQAVLAAIRDLKLQHKSMEFFGAKPDRPIDACLAEVAKSNVLVVIVGHKYGSLVPGRSISFSEAEYQEGHRLNKPCLVYMRDPTIPVLPKDFESDPDKLRALETFRAVLNDHHTVASFRASKDLAQAVASDLHQTIELVETERHRQEEVAERRSAFLVELENIATAALTDGYREALILSAVRGAVGDLRGRPPSLAERLANGWGNLIDMLSQSPERERPWVFFSYAHSDQQAVQPVANQLRKLRDEEPRPYRRGLLTVQAALDPSPARPGAAHTVESWLR